MGHTKILLREDVDDLGARGEIVRVRAGYARNYLLPRNLAVEATAGNVKGIEQERAALLKKEAKERATAEAQSQQMGSLVLEFKRKAGEQGALYGSVTSMDVAEALRRRYQPRGQRARAIPGAPPALDKPLAGCAFAARCSLRFEKCVEAPPLFPTGDGAAAACWHLSGGNR